MINGLSLGGALRVRIISFLSSTVPDTSGVVLKIPQFRKKCHVWSSEQEDASPVRRPCVLSWCRRRCVWVTQRLWTEWALESTGYDTLSHGAVRSQAANFLEGGDTIHSTLQPHGLHSGGKARVFAMSFRVLYFWCSDTWGLAASDEPPLPGWANSCR